MADIFISYAHQDGELVKELSPALEAAGYTTWYYEDKGAIGASYLRQIDQEIQRCHAMIVVISPDSIDSDQVSKEVIRAHEAKKKFVPVRRDISHAEFQERQPEWRMAFGAAVSAEVPAEGAAALGPRLVAGLKALGVEPGGPPALPTSPLRRLSRGIAAKDSKLGSTVAIVIGIIGVLVALGQLTGMVAPTTPHNVWLARTFPAFRQVTILVNAANLLLYAAMLYAAWRLRRGDARGASTIRLASLGILAAVVVWFLVSFSQFSGEEVRHRFPSPTDQSALIQGTIRAAFLGLVPAGIVFALFRNAKKRPER
jgi:hypothetical protein